MSEFKGTKGEWEYKVVRTKNQTKITVQIPATKYESKTELILGHLDREDDCGVSSCCKITEHANAKLIACAPEMLEFLFTIESSENTPDMHRRKAIQLIKKATE